MNSIPFTSSFKSAISDPFYKRIEQSHGISLIETPKPKKHGLRLPFMQDEVLISLHKKAKIMQTGDIPKKLAVYKEYIVWFSTTMSKVFPRTPPIFAATGTKDGVEENKYNHEEETLEFPTVEGYADIKGFFVQTNDTVDAFFSDSLRHLAEIRSRQIAMPETPTDGQIVNVSPPAPRHGPQIPEAVNHKAFQSKTKYYFRFQRHKNDSFVETIFFDSEADLAAWRGEIAAAPVFFGDFYSRYKILDHISKEGKNKIVQINLKGCDDPMIARYRTLTNAHDKADFGKVQQEFLHEAVILNRLNPINISARFHELHFANNGFFLVEDQLQATTFADWYVDTWGFELDSNKEAGTVLSLLKDLAQLVLSMTDMEVSHGNINKYTILVSSLVHNSPQTGTRTLQKKKTVRGFSNLYFKALNKHSRQNQALMGTLTAPNEEPDSAQLTKRSSQIYSRYKLCLTAFGDAVDTQINLIQQIPHRTVSSPKKEGRYTTFAKRHGATAADVLRLGYIFCEILYGIDIPKAVQQRFGLESQFASEILAKPQTALFSRDPLYEVDESLIDILAGMLDPDPTKRPTIREVFDVLQNCTTEPKHGGKRRATKERNTKVGGSLISRLSFDIQTPMSGFNRRQVYQMKVIDSGSTQFGVVDHVQRSPAPFQVDEASPLDESSPKKLSDQNKLTPVVGNKADDQISQASSFKRNAVVKVAFAPKVFNSSQPLLAKEALKFLERGPVRLRSGHAPDTDGSARRKPSIFERITKAFGDPHVKHMQSKVLVTHDAKDIIEPKARNASPTLSNVSSTKMLQVFYNGRELFRAENKLKRVILPANNSEINSEFNITVSGISRDHRIKTDSPRRSPSLHLNNSYKPALLPQELKKLEKPFRNQSLKLSSNISREKMSTPNINLSPLAMRRRLNLKISLNGALVAPASLSPRGRGLSTTKGNSKHNVCLSLLLHKKSVSAAPEPTSRKLRLGSETAFRTVPCHTHDKLQK